MSVVLLCGPTSKRSCSIFLNTFCIDYRTCMWCETVDSFLMFLFYAEYFLVHFTDDDELKICEKKELKYIDDKLHAFWSPSFYPAIIVEKSSE